MVIEYLVLEITAFTFNVNVGGQGGECVCCPETVGYHRT